MAKKITFKVPTSTGLTEDRTGTVAWIKVGNRKIKFVLQNEGIGAVTLTHFASGYRFGSLNEARVEWMAIRGPYDPINNHGAAAFLIGKKIAEKGADKVLAVIDAAPVINQ
ncbi:MAG TPA: hypothetical protein VGJ20_28860 [Xanthobacteraceae bacterium]